MSLVAGTSHDGVSVEVGLGVVIVAPPDGDVQLSGLGVLEVVRVVEGRAVSVLLQGSLVALQLVPVSGVLKNNSMVSCDSDKKTSVLGTNVGHGKVLDDGQGAASTVELEGGGEAEQGNGEEQDSLHVCKMSQKQLVDPWSGRGIYRRGSSEIRRLPIYL